MAIRWIVNSGSPDQHVIDAAVDVLRRGELLVLPTETVYGLAVDPGQSAAMESLYRAKSRPEDKSLALLVDDFEGLPDHGIAKGSKAEALARRYWPGPLTLVIPSRGGFVGYRVPDHPVALAVLRGFGGPVAASSANVSGRPPALTADEAERSLGGAVSAILDAGPVPGGVPSTVVRVSAGRTEVLREGAIPASEIEQIGS